ncbi:hypothetical protein AMK06_CH01045 [Rhizobium sp. N541]|nr:hypothetical protein AMK05_CH01084 [Rhizobium sp. N324]ANM15983.1 hypothetical protein AMK06_CH01045 [Rhizobium sp. N541]ANM22371.1 hypothetical protein AMK07_CH01045 [Rhizobium sp. N941]OYD03080.1 hypothetical protein AMK08_CH101080 [Rhizobium sp. N4311]
MEKIYLQFKYQTAENHIVWASKIIKFIWAAIFSFIYIVLAFFVISTALMFIQNPDFIGVTFPERAISDAARLTGRSKNEIDGGCSMKGSYFDKQVTCDMRRVQGNKITDTVLLEYRVMFDTIMSFNDIRENLE